jgi:hypothetical protein
MPKFDLSVLTSRTLEQLRGEFETRKFREAIKTLEVRSTGKASKLRPFSGSPLPPAKGFGK